MVFGVGTALVSTAQTGKTDSVFTLSELALISDRPSPAFAEASRRAGKEAVRTALRLTGEPCLREVEILEDKNGAPLVFLHGETARTAEERGVSRIELSLSYEQTLAAAAAIAFTD